MRHTYATDAEERRFAPFVFAVLAILGAFGISHLAQGAHVSLPSWLPMPVDTLALYGFVHWLYDTVLWPHALLHHWKLTKIPNLNGEWSGKVLPSETSGESAGLTRESVITVVIEQSWRHIAIKGHTDLSHSRSLSANIIVNDDWTLSYEFTNEPYEGAPMTMHPHRGTAILHLSDNSRTLKGYYYSGRGSFRWTAPIEVR